MSTLGLYRPGTSPVHRLAAGIKLTGLALAGAGSVLVDRPWQVAVALGLVTLGYLAAHLPPRLMVAQARPLLWVLMVLAGFHALVSGWQQAVVATGVILALVLLAGLVTLTSRTSELVDAVVAVLAPLRRFGVDPQRVALLLALGVRSVFVVVQIAEEVRDAQRARGLTGSPRAYAVPLIIRSLRHADALAEALVARGADD